MTDLTRRSALRGLAGALAYSVSGWAAEAEAQNASDGLGQLAAEKGLLFGAAMMGSELAPESQALFVRQVRAITPSNELKMAAVRPTAEVIDFSGADALIAFAEEHGLAIRGHNLIWNEWQPAWVRRLSRAEIESLIDRHIDLVVGRYRGRIHTWDVVNEPIGTEKGEAQWLGRGPYLDALGPAYIARSLRRARAADPKAKLLLNETHTEREDAFGWTCRQRVLRLIDQLQQDGTPLDGIGLQGHLEPTAAFSPNGFLSFCEQIAARGLEIQITELDVLDTHFPDEIETRDWLVADAIYTFLSAALQCKAVKLVATWHLADHYSYPYREAIKKNPNAKRRPRPLLFDEQQNRKPAWHAVARAFAEMQARG